MCQQRQQHKQKQKEEVWEQKTKLDGWRYICGKTKHMSVDIIHFNDNDFSRASTTGVKSTDKYTPQLVQINGRLMEKY